MRWTALTLTFALLAASRPATAAWPNQSGNLPGMVSGKSIAITAAAVGGAAVAALLLLRKYHKPKATTLDVPDRLSLDRGEARLVLRNRGQSTVSVSGVALKGKGFDLPRAVSTPAVVTPGGTLEIPVRMKEGGSARMELTYVENGKQYRRSVAIRGKAAEPAGAFRP